MSRLNKWLVKHDDTISELLSVIVVLIVFLLLMTAVLYVAGGLGATVHSIMDHDWSW